MYTELATEDGATLRVVYKLLESQIPEGAAYGLRCYVAGDGAFCEARDLLCDRTLAGGLLARVAAAGVMPVHIDDVIYELLY